MGRGRFRIFRLIGVTALASGLTGVVAGPGVGARGDTAGLLPDSFFDHSITGRPAAAGSSDLVADLTNQYETHYGSIGVNRMPIFTVPAGQPLVPVSLATGCYGSFLSTLGPGIPIPPGAYNSNSSDDFLVVDQPSTGREWELWRATDTNGRWSACWGGSLNMPTSTGVFPAPFGMSATGISYLATTVTEADVASGHIDHAIAMQIVDCHGSVAPADRTDCGGDAGAPPEGTWFRLPPTTPLPADLTPFARMVFQALQSYGGVVVDHAGAVMIEAENSRDWAFQGHSGPDPITAAFAGKPQYAVLNGMPWSQLQVIVPPLADPASSATNLLTGTQTSFSGTTGGWTPLGNSSLSSAPPPSALSTGSLAMTATSQAWVYAGSPQVAANPGATYTGVASLVTGSYAPVADVLAFYDSSGRLIRTVAGPSTPAASTWARLAPASAVAPPSTARVALIVVAWTASVGQTLYIGSPVLATG